MPHEGSSRIRVTRIRGEDRLHSWKEIAAWFDRTERTVQRWERLEGLPVHRLHHAKGGSVFADPAELEAWATRRQDLTAEEPHKRARWTRRHAFILGAIVLVVGCGWLGWIERESTAAAPRPSRLTAYQGTERMPSFAPDGSNVVFSWDPASGRQGHLYVKMLGLEPPKQLTFGDGAELWPAWSPDSRWISCLRPGVQGGASELLRISAWGSPEQKLGSVCNYDRLLPYPYQSWTADSRHIVVADRSQAQCQGPFALFRLDPESGERVMLTNPQVGPGDSAPSVSPDGKRLAFIRWGMDRYKLMVMDLAGDSRPREPAPVALVEDRSPLSAPLWMKGGRQILYTAFAEGAHHFWRVPASGGKPEAVSVDGRIGGAAAMSRQGDKIAFAVTDSDYDLWRLDLQMAQAKPQRIAQSTARELNPAFSVDGRRLAFVSERSGRYQVWVSDADGSNATQATRLEEGAAVTPAWSPDGRELAFSQRLDDKWRLMVTAADGSGVRRITTPDDARGPEWSPDGLWIYYYSRAGSSFAVFRVPAGGGSSEEVIASRASVPRFDPVGGHLFCFQGQPTPGLWRHGRSRSERVAPVFRDLNAFVVRGSGVYLEGLGKPPESILYHRRFDTGGLEKRSAIAQGIEGGFTISPDERFLVFASFELRGSDLWLIENLP